MLGACLLSREALAAVAGLLEPAHFAEELHRRIFAAMRERLAEGGLATLVTLGPLLSDLDLPEGAAAPAYLARLAASAPSIVNAPDYARQIVDLARRRAIMRVARGALDAAASPAIGGPTQAIAADAIDGLNEIVAAGGERRRRPLSESAEDLLRHAQEIRAGKLVSQAATTGFRDLDTATGGYEAGALWIVAARPGVGKTIFQVTSSLKVARAGARSLRETGQGFGALAYSLEVPERQVCARYLSDLCYLPRAPIEYGRIARGEFSDEEAGRLAAAQKTLARLPLTLDASSKLTLAEIGAGVRAEKAAMARAGSRLAVAFVDYSEVHPRQRSLQGPASLRGRRNLGRTEATRQGRGALHRAAGAAQSRAGSREDKRPNLSDLRESGDLEADADVVLFLHREAHRILKSPEFRAGSAEAHARYARGGARGGTDRRQEPRRAGAHGETVVPAVVLDDGRRGEGGGMRDSMRKKARARPSPVHGRRWLREAESDEGRRSLVGTSRGPSSDPAAPGHLLPQVGEGFAPLSRDFGDRRADHVERDVSAADHQLVAKPEDRIAMFAQPGVARGVARFLLVAIMRRAVEFDREAMLHAEEIHDVTADWNLPAELQPVQPAAAQRAPEHRLGQRHLAPKFAGEGGAVFRDAGGHGEVSRIEESCGAIGALACSTKKKARGESFSRSREKVARRSRVG